MLYTDKESEIDTFLLDARIKQLKFMLEDATIQEQRYNNNKQAYTYKFCEKWLTSQI